MYRTRGEHAYHFTTDAVLKDRMTDHIQPINYIVLIIDTIN